MKPRHQTKHHSYSLRPAGAALATLLYGGAAVAQVANITPITVPNGVAVTVSALNRQGNVAGYFTEDTGALRAFFWNGVALDQGTLGGSSALGLDLNDFDQTTGYAYSVGDASFRAFLGTGRTLVDLGSLGGSSSLGRSINNAGSVTGYSFVSPASANFRAFLNRRGVMTDLGTLGGPTSAGVDINDHDEVAGDSDLADGLTYHGFFFDGVMHDIGTLGGAFSSVTDLNNLGQVTGIAGTDTGEDHAFLYGDGVIRDLGTLGGSFSIGYAINDAGVVSGDSAVSGDVIQGFVWSGGVMTSVGHLGSQFSSVWGMNNSNQVVGVSSDAQGASRAFLWRDGAILDLNATLPAESGWVLDAAYLINDAGQIVGTGIFQGQPSWYRLELHEVNPPNQPPVARAGADALAECGTDAVLDGSGSSDPDGDILSFAWLKGEHLLGETAQLSVALDPGVHALRLRVTDPSGASSEDEVLVTVRDSQAPAVLCPEGRSAPANEQGVAAVPDYLAGLVATDGCSPAGQLEKQQTPAAGTLVGCGVHPVTLRVVDSAGNVTVCDAFFTVVDTTAPRVEAPGAVTQAVGNQCTAEVPNLLPHVQASDNCTPREQLMLTQEPAAGTAVGLGEHAVSIRVVDAAGNATVKPVTLRVVDQTAPVIHSVSATPDVIRPANKQMVPVTISVVSSDQCDPSPVRRIVRVESSDPEAQADRSTTPDWIVTGDLTLELRAEVTEQDFRIYTVVVSSTDQSGNSSLSTVQVVVQKNKNSGGATLEAALAAIAAKAKGKAKK